MSRVYLVWRRNAEEKSLLGIFEKKEDAKIFADKETSSYSTNDFVYDEDFEFYVEGWDVE